MANNLIKELKAKKQEYIYLDHEYEAAKVNFRIKRPKVKDVLKHMESYPRAFTLVQEGMNLDNGTVEPKSVLEVLQGAEEMVEVFQKLILVTCEYQIDGEEEWSAFAEGDEERLAPADLGGEVVAKLGQTIFQSLARIGS